MSDQPDQTCNTAFYEKQSKMREELQRTEMRNFIIFMVMFTLCLQTVRGKEIFEPFYGICYGFAGYLVGIAVNKSKTEITK